jgi:hypothetical protein
MTSEEPVWWYIVIYLACKYGVYVNGQAADCLVEKVPSMYRN